MSDHAKRPVKGVSKINQLLRIDLAMVKGFGYNKSGFLRKFTKHTDSLENLTFIRPMSTRRSMTPKTKELNGDRPESADPTVNGSQRVDQIRDLIFGEQMSGYEARFAALEQKFEAEIVDLRNQVEAQLEEVNQILTARVDDVEEKSVPRSQIATSLERLAKTLRG